VPALILVRRAAGALGALLIAALLLLIVVDVLGRNLFGRPLPGTPELVTLSILVIVFLLAPEAVARGRLARSNALQRGLAATRPRLARVLAHAHDLAGMLAFSIVLIGTWPLLIRAIVRDEFVGSIGEFIAPVWPVRLAVLVGSGLLVIEFARRLCRRWSRSIDS